MRRFDRTAACLLAILAMRAEADVDKAKVLYDQGKLEAAATEFRKSAELGHAESQFNLGALHFNGHGVQRSADLAAAWMFVAADNGYADAVAEIRRFATDLTPAAEGLAQELRARYGKEAIAQRLLPGHATFVPTTGTVDDAAAKAFEPNATRRRKPLRTVNATDVPFSAPDRELQVFPGFLAIDMVVAPDGSVRDVLPVLFYPSDVADRDQYRYAFARLEIESVPANWSRAAELLQRAVEKANERAALALAAVRATCPDEKLRSADVESLLKLARGTYGEEPMVREIRAARAAALGDFAQAVEEQNRAIDEARDLSWNVAPLEARLDAYRKNERWLGDLLAF